MQRMTKFKIILSFNFITTGLMIWGYYVFLKAYFNNYQLMLFVNNYNEADLELVVIPILIVGVVLSHILLWKLYFDEKKGS